MRPTQVWNRIRSSLGLSYVAGAAMPAPIVLGVLWWMAGQANRLDTAHQMRAFFGVLLPFMAGAAIAMLMVQRRIFVGRGTRRAAIIASAGAVVFAWPATIMALIVRDLAAIRLPMLDERTPAPLHWWLLFTLGWIVLAAACGALYVWASDRHVSLAEPAEKRLVK